MGGKIHLESHDTTCAFVKCLLTSPERFPSVDSAMNPNRAVKHFVFAFLLALIGYAVVYSLIEHSRNRKGPWTVSFQCPASGAPTLVINEPALSITNVRVVLAGENPGRTNPACTLVFDQPRPVPFPVPFGQCVFMDTTFLPGTLTFHLFEHEIEFLPRVLVIDHQEHAWVSGTTLTLVKGHPSPGHEPEGG
jgi:hypothetical protein